jgi:hypothetical protein
MSAVRAASFLKLGASGRDLHYDARMQTRILLATSAAPAAIASPLPVGTLSTVDCLDAI